MPSTDKSSQTKAVTQDAAHEGMLKASNLFPPVEKDWDWNKAVKAFGEKIRAMEATLDSMKNRQAYLIAGHYNDDHKVYLKQFGIDG